MMTKNVLATLGSTLSKTLGKRCCQGIFRSVMSPENVMRVFCAASDGVRRARQNINDRDSDRALAIFMLYRNAAACMPVNVDEYHRREEEAIKLIESQLWFEDVEDLCNFLTDWYDGIGGLNTEVLRYSITSAMPYIKERIWGS